MASEKPQDFEVPAKDGDSDVSEEQLASLLLRVGECAEREGGVACRAKLS